MKALIIYDDITSALRASQSLRSASRRADTKSDWEIKVWRANMLRFRSVADEALRDAAGVDLIVFAGCRPFVLPLWLKGWLEQWASCRQVPDAAVAVIEEQASATRSESLSSDLSEFALSHNLGFIASHQQDREIETLRLQTGNLGHRRVPAYVVSASIDLLPASTEWMSLSSKSA